MKQTFEQIIIDTENQGLTNITSAIERVVQESSYQDAIINISCLHTSASLIVQENASDDVLEDLKQFFNQLVPMDNSLYRHTIEGKDDMPAHIKSALTQNQLTLSIQNSKLQLGVWQGIFLFEHRIQPHQRKLLLHLIGQ